MNTFDPESLSQYNGKEGRPVFVAHKGRIIDVSASKFWKTGIHMNRHPAGRDLTADIEAAPHGPEVLDRYPQVGTLKQQDGAERDPCPNPWNGCWSGFPSCAAIPTPWSFTSRSSLRSRRCSSICSTGSPLRRRSRPPPSTAWGPASSFVCRPSLTGFFTWWLNYQAKPLRPVLIKIRFSGLLVAVYLAAFHLPAPLPRRRPFPCRVGYRLSRAARGPDPGRDRHRLVRGEPDLSPGEKIAPAGGRAPIRVYDGGADGIPAPYGEPSHAPMAGAASALLGAIIPRRRHTGSRRCPIAASARWRPVTESQKRDKRKEPGRPVPGEVRTAAEEVAAQSLLGEAWIGRPSSYGPVRTHFSESRRYPSFSFFSPSCRRPVHSRR